MASIASQIVLHPTVSQTLKVLGTTLGRDKARASHYVLAVIGLFLHMIRYIAPSNTFHVSLLGIL